MAFPKGWQIVNEPEQILAIGPNKEHFMEVPAQAPPADVTDPREFAMRGLANRRLERPERLDINGLDALTAVVRGDPSPYGSHQCPLHHHPLQQPDVGLQGCEPLGRGRRPRAIGSSCRRHRPSAACAPTNSRSPNRIA